MDYGLIMDIKHKLLIFNKHAFEVNTLMNVQFHVTLVRARITNHIG